MLGVVAEASAVVKAALLLTVATAVLTAVSKVAAVVCSAEVKNFTKYVFFKRVCNTVNSVPVTFGILFVKKLRILVNTEFAVVG